MFSWAGGGGGLDKLITRKYQGSGSGLVPGRDAGFQVGTTSDPDQDYDATYHYDDTGRFNRIEGPGLPAYGVRYLYGTNSDLIASRCFVHDTDDCADALARSERVYEETRGLVD